VVISPLQSVTYQRFSRLLTTGSNNLLNALQRVALLVALPLAALTLLLVPFVPFALRIVAGPRYAPAAPAAQVLVALSAVWMLTLWLKPIAFTLHEVHAWALAAGLTAGLSLVGFLSLTPSFGFQGAAWARFAAVTMGQIILVFYLIRRHGNGKVLEPVTQE
jgi:O-antigen/teichoic acid export membrane protein